MKLKMMMVCLLALVAAPFAYAHEPAGTPKLYCEPATEWNTHDYGPPATGRLLWGFIDGNLDDCDGDFDPTNPVCWAEELTREDADGDGDVCEAFDYDEHAEWSRGGAWLLSCSENCGVDSMGHPGSGSLVCFGSVAHHASLPTVRVVDNSGLTGIEFRVAADYGTLDPLQHDLEHDPVSGDVCGDFTSDVRTVCFDVCTVTFPPGLDGSYQVYVVGTAGHVCTSSCSVGEGLIDLNQDLYDPSWDDPTTGACFHAVIPSGDDTAAVDTGEQCTLPAGPEAAFNHCKGTLRVKVWGPVGAKASGVAKCNGSVVAFCTATRTSSGNPGQCAVKFNSSGKKSCQLTSWSASATGAACYV